MSQIMKKIFLFLLALVLLIGCECNYSKKDAVIIKLLDTEGYVLYTHNCGFPKEYCKVAYVNSFGEYTEETFYEWELEKLDGRNIK